MSSTHRAREFFGPSGRECLVCGDRVVGAGLDLRHEGETIPVTVPDRKDAPLFHAALREVTAATSALPEEASRDEVVRAALEVAYARGFLRQRRGDRHAWAAEPRERQRDIVEVDRADALTAVA